MKKISATIQIFTLFVCCIFILSGCSLLNNANEKNETIETNARPSDSASVKDGKTGFYIYHYEDLGIIFEHPEVLKKEKFQSWMNSDGSVDCLYGFKSSSSAFFSGNVIKYGIEQGNEFFSIWISKKDALDLIAEPSCDSLAGGREKEFSLPEQFSEPNLCDFVKGDGYAAYYVIGKSFVFEGLSMISSSILVLTPEYAIILSGKFGVDPNEELKTWVNEYVNNNPEKDFDFPTKDYGVLSGLTDEKLKSMMLEPTEKIKNDFIFLKEIANSISIERTDVLDTYPFYH